MGVCFNVMFTMSVHRLIVLFMCALLLSGWSGSWETLRQESAGIISVSSSFTQSKHMRILAKPLVSQGKFYFRAPDSVRWEYDTPVKSILLMHDGMVKRYTRVDQDLVEDTGAALQSMNVMLEEIVLWSSGRFNESRGFAAELRTGAQPAILLTPRDAGLAKIISGIDIELAPETAGVISTITIREGEGSTTILRFSDVLVNSALDSSLFVTP